MYLLRTIETPATEACLHRMFEAQAARTPHADAILFDGEALSYRELNARANRLARRLRSLKVGPGSLVGVCLTRSPEMVVALLGVLKSGGAYVPLDPEYPTERLTFLLTDAQADVLLTTAKLRRQLPAYTGTTLFLDSDRLDSEEDAGDLPGGAEPDDLAYVIYTSGSTGTPKGVMLAHRGACNNLQWRQEAFPLTAGDRLLQTYSFSFDPSVWAFFWPLTVGAAVLLPRPGEHGDPARLVQSLREERVTVAGFSPSLLSALLDTGGKRPLRASAARLLRRRSAFPGTAGARVRRPAWNRAPQRLRPDRGDHRRDLVDVSAQPGRGRRPHRPPAAPDSDLSAR